MHMRSGGTSGCVSVEVAMCRPADGTKVRGKPDADEAAPVFTSLGATSTWEESIRV